MYVVLSSAKFEAGKRDETKTALYTKRNIYTYADGNKKSTKCVEKA